MRIPRGCSGFCIGAAAQWKARCSATLTAPAVSKTQAFTTNIWTTLRKSLTLLESSGYTPAFIVLSLGDFEIAAERLV